ncbi:MAG TPA: hypothetical protein VI796_04380 [Candidatus Thermoplasmatota archaeon]|nr:hypothetical protein [Candidatus Thermoplasmatota archaeon]
MRTVVALLALALAALAGCAVGPPGDAEPTGCQRVTAPGTWSATNGFYYNRTLFDGPTQTDGGRPSGATGPPEQYGIGAGRLEFDGRQLDRFEIELKPGGTGLPHGMAVVDANVEAQVVNARTGEPLLVIDLRFTDGAGHYVPQDRLRFAEGTRGNFTFFVPLADAAEPAAPDPIRIHWLFLPDLDHDPDTPSVVHYNYIVSFLYRDWDGICTE